MTNLFLIMFVQFYKKVEKLYEKSRDVRLKRDLIFKHVQTKLLFMNAVTAFPGFLISENVCAVLQTSKKLYEKI